MAVGRQVGRHGIGQLVIPDRVAGQDLELQESSQRRIAADPTSQPHAFQHPPLVARLGEEVAIDLRLVTRVVTGPVTRSASSAAGSPDGGVLLRTAGLARDFGGVRAVAGVSIEVRRGTLTGLIGPQVLLGDRDITGLAPEEVAGRRRRRTR